MNARKRGCMTGRGAKASCNVNRSRKAYCKCSMFPFSKMPHSITKVIAGLMKFLSKNVVSRHLG